MSPAIRGVIESRILVNYCVDVETLDTMLPGPFRGREVGETGKGVGSVCFTRIENASPRFAPDPLGVSVETATHRISAELEGEDGNKFCVYVPQRDASSRFCAAAGKYLLPTDFDCGDFQVEEFDGAQKIRVDCGDGYAGVVIRETSRDEIDDDSVFYSLESASMFLCEGGVEYTPSGDGYRYGGVEFCPRDYEVEPVDVADSTSSYFRKLGGEFDSAFRIKDVEHEWRPRRSIITK